MSQVTTTTEAAVLSLREARQVAGFFQILADPTRVRIIKALADDEWCVSDLAQALGMDQPAVSHQLKYLRELRLVRWKKSGRHVYYALADQRLAQLLLRSVWAILDHP